MLKNLPFVIFLLFIIGPMFGRNFFPLLIMGIIFYFVFKKHGNGFDFLKNLNNLNNLNKNKSNVIDLDKFNFIKNMKKSIFSFFVLIFGLWLFFASIYIVDAGETGVYSLFGKVKDAELSSGFHLVLPLARVHRMSIRTEEYTMSVTKGEGQVYESDAITSLTKEGLSVDLDMTVLYRLDEAKASDVFREVGTNYEEKIIRPMIRTSIRDVIAGYEAKDIYSEKRGEASAKIKESLKNNIEARGIIVEDVLLRNVALPTNLSNAIQSKLQAEQESEKYNFILSKEKKEKERKIIEAEGQRDAQKIINESLSENYLYYLYINQLKDRQGTIYVPTGSTSGMPLFKNIGE